MAFLLAPGRSTMHDTIQHTVHDTRPGATQAQPGEATTRPTPPVSSQRVGLDARDVVSYEGAVFTLIAVALFIAGLATSIAGLLILAGIATVVAVGFTVVTAAHSLSAPTQAE